MHSLDVLQGIRDISAAEVEQAMVDRSEVIEDDPDDKYGPSCLILGFTRVGRPLHIQCSYPSWTDSRITGEQYFSPDTVQRIHALLKSNKQPDKMIQTPVYEFA